MFPSQLAEADLGNDLIRLCGAPKARRRNAQFSKRIKGVDGGEPKRGSRPDNGWYEGFEQRALTPTAVWTVDRQLFGPSS